MRTRGQQTARNQRRLLIYATVQSVLVDLNPMRIIKRYSLELRTSITRLTTIQYKLYRGLHSQRTLDAAPGLLSINSPYKFLPFSNNPKSYRFINVSDSPLPNLACAFYSLTLQYYSDFEMALGIIDPKQHGEMDF